MTEWGTHTQSFQGHDMSWLGSAFGVDMGLPIELDLALFDFVTDFPNGFLPPGILLAKTGSVYGHYDPGTVVNEQQSLIATGGTAGDFTLTFDGETTGAIAWNADATAVRTALEGLSNIDPGDVVVAGGPLPGTAVTITFQGQYADQNVPALVVTDNVTNGNATITTPQGGGGTGAATGGAGLDVAKGFLLFPVSTVNMLTKANLTTGPATAALFTRGRVREANLPATSRLDDAAKAALPLIEFI